jgi:hypothetical protein
MMESRMEGGREGIYYVRVVNGNYGAMWTIYSQDDVICQTSGYFLLTRSFSFLASCIMYVIKYSVLAILY